MIDRFSRSVALRNLAFSRGQSALTVGVVAISVTLIIFLGALIGGLQRRLISSVTGSIAHVVVRQPERDPVAAWDLPRAPGDPVAVGEAVKLQQRRLKIEDWAVWVPRLRDYDPGVIAVSPVVEGQGILARGEKRLSVSVTGVVPELHNEVVEIQEKLVEGRFHGLNGGEVAVGYKLAEDFALRLGDKVRITSSEGNVGDYAVAGIFDTGFAAVDGRTVFVTLRDAQSLFQLGTAVTSIGLKLRAIFEADELAARLRTQVPYEANSWMRDNQTLLSGLRAQSQSSNLIIAFTVVASGFGIASILIMAVVSKLREIGIYKAIGATRRQILTTFALQGTLLAILGSLVGTLMGVGLSLLLMQARMTASATGRTIEVFPMLLTGGLVATAVAVATGVGFVASLYPAWRAARVNPIDVIRGT